MRPALSDSAGGRRPLLSPMAGLWLQGAVAAGVAAFVAGLFLDPVQAWGAFLMGFVVLLSLALAGPVFCAFLALAGARWSAPLLRVPEALGSALPAAFVLGGLLAFGTSALYEWSHPAVVAADPILSGRAAWFTTAGFAARTLFAIGLWTLLARRLRAASERHAASGNPVDRARRVRAAALLLATVALGYPVVVTDWLMSLEPHWFSTIFALLHFASLASLGLAAACLVLLHLERQGALAGILRDEHVHDLSRLLFAVTLIWAYCFYCQYMLIWYTNIPEETTWYTLRQEGTWPLMLRASLVLGFVVPFLAQLGRSGCRSRRVLARVSISVLAGHLLALHVQIGPPLREAQAAPGVIGILAILAALAAVALIAFADLRRGPVVRAHPGELAQSLRYHVP